MSLLNTWQKNNGHTEISGLAMFKGSYSQWRKHTKKEQKEHSELTETWKEELKDI